MAEDIIFPRVDMDMTSGQISRWFFKDGDRVEKGQPLFEIETDKAAMEIDASVAGILRAPAEIGQQINVGATVGWIVAQDEVFVEPDAKSTVAETSHHDVARSDVTPQNDLPPKVTPPANFETSESGTRATPLARQLAKSHSIMIETVKGSGPHGRVQARDIEQIADHTVPTQIDLRGVTHAQNNAPLMISSDPLNGVMLREGQGDPLIFIHGFGADLNSWRPVVQSLGHGRAIFALDLPGHGQSPWQGATHINTVVDAVAKRIEATGYPSFHLVGHSLGAAIATLLANRFKAKAKSLFLISPAGLGPEINEAFINGFCRSTQEASLRAWMAMLVADHAVLSDAFIRLTALGRAQGQVAAAHHALADLAFGDGAQALSIRPILERLDLPTRVVMGLADQIIPPRHVDDLPGFVAVHRLKSVGHMPHVEARELLARLIREHIGGQI